MLGRKLIKIHLFSVTTTTKDKISLQQLLVQKLSLDVIKGASTTVTYDHKALVIDGERRILQSGSVHYPRTTPEIWPEIFRKAKEGGLDVIESYVFWNYHEPVKGEV
ncbi:hypothetical protein BC332_04711 [Capsicum chinense]|nr:hypothetical protein BC332_04711 [Capsicum chinense]